jgi:hypothetical protein
MSGEINGSNIIIQNSVGDIVGQGAFTHTFNGTPIDISNKSFQDYITTIDGELSGKQHVFSGEIVYNNDAAFRKVRSDAFTGTQDTYTLTYVGSGDAVDESFTGKFTATGLSDALPHGESVKTTISFNSSGNVTIVPASDV